jgi:chemotaxis protein CheD
MSKTRITVDISDMKVSNDPDVVLTTYSLGSCIGVCLYDPVEKVGGMLHYQLPSSKTDTTRSKENPLMFADTGMEIMLSQMEEMGVKKKRMSVRIAGGAAMQGGPEGFDIGKRNHLAIKKILWQNGMFIDAEDVGGSSARNMYMNIETGEVTIRSSGLEKSL